MKKIIYAAALLMIGSFIVISCSKNSSDSNNVPAGSKALSVYMTDAPANFDAVFIDIASIEAKVDTSSHKDDDHFGDDDHDGDNDSKMEGDHDNFGFWMNLNVPAGKYNLLTLRNGLDTLIAKSVVKGTVRKIRIKLGDGSYVFKGGTQYPLTLINRENHKNYVYINLHDEDRDEDDATQVKIWIDFDLGRSIIERDGKFYLLPVLKPFCDRKFAQITGKVLPNDAGAIVKAFNAMDTASAFPNDDGYFRIRGLKAGTYSVMYHSTNGYKDTTISNVMVTRGKQTDLPAVTLKK